MRRFLLSAPFSFALSAVVGCADGNTSQSSSTPTTAATTSPERGAATSEQQPGTPQTVYAAVAEAANSHDYETLARLLTRDSQITMAAGMIFLAEQEAESYGSDLIELRELLGRHGIQNTSTRGLQLPPDASQLTIGEAITRPLKDLTAFLGEMGAWKAKNGHDFVGGLPELGALTRLTIDGDSARGACQSNMGPQLIAFRKESGRWKFHIPTDASQSELDALEDVDGTPALGTLSWGDKEVTLRHANAFESSFLDEPCVVVLLSQHPISQRDMNELKDKLADLDDPGATFAARGPHLRLLFDTKGELVSMFAWFINGYEEITNEGDLTEMDVKIDGRRVHGSAALAPSADSNNRFEAKFDVQLLRVD